jgi:hypothetical protein
MADTLYDPVRDGPITQSAPELYDPAKHGPIVQPNGATRLYSPNPDAPQWSGAPDTNAPVPIPAAMAMGQSFAPPQPSPKGLSLGDVGSGFVSNFLPSVGNFVSNTYDAVTHPARTITGVGQLLGAGLRASNGSQDAAKTFTEPLYNRYGTIENLKKTIATDPFGFLMDATTPITGAETLGLRAPGLVGEGLRLLDPVNAVTKAGQGIGNAAEFGASHLLGTTTGAGARDIRAAARAGLEGNPVLLKNAYGTVPMDDVVGMARKALSDVRQERGNAYRSGMLDISKDKSILDFDPIDEAVDNAAKVGTFKGQTIEPAAVDTVNQMAKQVADWKALDPAEFHTAEGIDALKRSLGNLRDSTPPNSPERVAADRIYGAVRDQITSQVPVYAGLMGAYSKASGDLRDLSKTFSLGENTSTDTALRKLQSTSRNNVQTNYGKRTTMLDALAEHQPDLPYALAGQNLSAIGPRGLASKIGGTVGAAVLGGHALEHGLDINTLLHAAYLLPLAPFLSPRAVGTGAYLAGRGAGLAGAGLKAVGVTGPRAATAARLGFRAGQINDTDSLPGFRLQGAR